MDQMNNSHNDDDAHHQLSRFAAQLNLNESEHKLSKKSKHDKKHSNNHSNNGNHSKNNNDHSINYARIHDGRRIVTIAYRLYPERATLNVEYAASVFRKDTEEDHKRMAERKMESILGREIKDEDRKKIAATSMEDFLRDELVLQNRFSEKNKKKIEKIVHKKHKNDQFSRRQHVQTARGRLTVRPLYTTFPLTNDMLDVLFERTAPKNKVDRRTWSQTLDGEKWREMRRSIDEEISSFLRREVTKHGVGSEERLRKSEIEKRRHDEHRISDLTQLLSAISKSDRSLNMSKSKSRAVHASS
jgi:hypothetical protein